MSTGPHDPTITRMTRPLCFILILALSMALILPIGGCEQMLPEDATPSSQSGNDDADAAPVPREFIVPDDAMQARMDEAIERAHMTALEAARKWRHSPDREHWYVIWAARTVGGGVEHVWVRPVTWNEHRIEGTLLSEPQRDLEAGRHGGEIVAFPADELSDWIHLVEGTFDGAREGGFTLEVIDE